MRVDGDGGNHHALDHGVRVVLEDQAILAGPRLGLVSVAEHVLGLGRFLRNEGPFHARRETRAAASAQIGRFHLVDDCLRSNLQRLLHGLVAVEFEIAVDVGGAHAKAPGNDLDLVGM